MIEQFKRKYGFSHLLIINGLFLLFFAFCFTSCQENEGEEHDANATKITDSLATENELNAAESIDFTPKEISEIEKKLIKAGLVDIQEIDSTILVDVKYATTDNFMRRVIYENYDKVYLQKEVAERLSRAQEVLKSIDTDLTLLVFDGARPRSVQQEMWDAMDTIPVAERIKFLSNPKNGSLHNYGCAVDLTIMNQKTMEWLDMGAGYDDLRKIAYPELENRFIASGELTHEQLENRLLLRETMRMGGFWVLPTEWWHFNAYTREKAAELYEIIE